MLDYFVDHLSILQAILVSKILTPIMHGIIRVNTLTKHRSEEILDYPRKIYIR